MAGASGFLMTTASAEQTADLIIARLYELAAGPAPLYQTAALNLRYRLRCNVEQSDGTWGGADTVAEVCQWMNEQGVSPEQDAT